MMLPPGVRRGLIWLSVSCVALLGACRFERRAPDGSPRDETTLQALTAGFYRALAQRDTASLDSVMFGAATALLEAGRSEPSLIIWRSLGDIPERRTRPPGVRLVRAEIRPDGDFASVRVVLASEDATQGSEYEATDLLTLARRSGSWRIAHVVFGPWRIRTAP